MRCLVASERFFGDAPGGAYAVAWGVSRLLGSAGHDVTLLCGSLPGDTPEGIDVRDGVRVLRYRIPAFGRWDPRRWTSRIAAARRALEKFAGGSWDAVHGHTVAETLAVAGVDARRFVVSVHSPVVMEQDINWAGSGVLSFARRRLGAAVLRRAERRALERADVIHVLSEFTHRELRRTHGDWISTRVQRLGWWVEPEGGAVAERESARATLGLPVRGSVFFTLRRLVPRMGIDTMIDALAGLRQRAFTAVIAGDGPDRSLLERRVAERGLEGKVRFWGRISDETRSLAYRAADLCVVPTRALECFGIVVLEALARGCPVVVSDAGALPELVGPLAPEAIFPAGDVTALRRLLERALDGALPLPSHDAAASYAREYFGRAALGPQYLAMVLGQEGVVR